MKARTIIVLVLVALVVVLLLQNSGMIDLKILLWHIYAPVFFLGFFLFCVGFLAGVLIARTGGRKAKKDTLPPSL
jgi:uncharacterized integral membrane protein